MEKPALVEWNAEAHQPDMAEITKITAEDKAAIDQLPEMPGLYKLRWLNYAAKWRSEHNHWLDVTKYKPLEKNRVKFYQMISPILFIAESILLMYAVFQLTPTSPGEYLGKVVALMVFVGGYFGGSYANGSVMSLFKTKYYRSHNNMGAKKSFPNMLVGHNKIKLIDLQTMNHINFIMTWDLKSPINIEYRDRLTLWLKAFKDSDRSEFALMECHSIMAKFAWMYKYEKAARHEMASQQSMSALK